MSRTSRTPGSAPTIVPIAVDARKPDLGVVDLLARLQLNARRRGCVILLRDAPDELRALLELVGLAGVLGLEAGREAELGEQLGVEEVVQPDDPAV